MLATQMNLLLFLLTFEFPLAKEKKGKGPGRKSWHSCSNHRRSSTVDLPSNGQGNYSLIAFGIPNGKILSNGETPFAAILFLKIFKTVAYLQYLSFHNLHTLNRQFVIPDIGVWVVSGFLLFSFRVEIANRSWQDRSPPANPSKKRERTHPFLLANPKVHLQRSIILVMLNKASCDHPPSLPTA